MHERQRQALQAADVLLGMLLKVVAEELSGPAVVIVLADHGGSGSDHQTTREVHTTVPWILWGDGVEPATLPSVSITATALAALHALGLEPPPALRAETGNFRRPF